MASDVPLRELVGTQAPTPPCNKVRCSFETTQLMENSMELLGP